MCTDIKQSFAMKSVTFFYLLPMFCSCVIHIDRITTDFNKKLLDFKISYTHNSNGDSVTNVTLKSYVNVTKMLAYVSLRMPEDSNDREYRRELLKTVVDLEKVSNGAQSNPIVRSYVNILMQYKDFVVKFPFRPVSTKSRRFN